MSEDAKKDAYREAVRQVVGAYVEGDTLTRNDDLIEDKVLALSGAIVQKADVVPESVTTSAGLTQLRVRAEVKVTEVLKTLAKINVTTTAVHTSDLVAQVTTTADQTQTAKAMLGDAMTWETFPASFFKMTAVGQPRVERASGDEATIELLLRLTPDSEKYFAFSKRLTTILASLRGAKGAFTVDGKKPACSPHEMKRSRQELFEHVLVSSKHGGTEPAIAYAFPSPLRHGLQDHFKNMGPGVAVQSGCLVYCFDQGNAGQWTLPGCGLKKVAKDWEESIGRRRKELMVICLLTQANDRYDRTEWEWFACDQAMFPGGPASPWLRCIECEVELRGSDGREIVTETVPLSEGFGVSRRHSASMMPQIVMLGPMWIEAASMAVDRAAYVPQFTFPLRIELSASEASSVTEVRCLVRPRLTSHN